MKEKNKTALVAGATGLVGKNCLEQLLKSPEYSKVYAFTRREIKNDNPKFEQIIVNFDYLENVQLPEKIDVVYCCLGTTLKKAGNKYNFRKVDYDYVMSLARLAEKMKVAQFFVISSVGTAKDSPFFYSRVKGETEEALKNLRFENINIIRPSLILGKRDEPRPLEEMAGSMAKSLNGLLWGSLKKYRAIAAEDIANAMLKISARNLEGYHIFESDQLEEIANTAVKK